MLVATLRDAEAAANTTDVDVDHISKMYFSHWKPPGVYERMWSVNLEESISGEYQTLGGHSGRPWE
jgi:hypothetical protein